MEVGGSLRRQSSLVADSLRGAPSLLVDPSTGPAPGGQNWGNSMIESGEIPLILVSERFGGTKKTKIRSGRLPPHQSSQPPQYDTLSGWRSLHVVAGRLESHTAPPSSPSA